MQALSAEDEQAVERLTLRLLQDAYCDLAAVLRGAQPQAAAAILGVMEQRVTDVLTRICRQGSEGAASVEIAVAVGERIGEIMDQAHGRMMGPACGPPEPVNPPRRSRHGRRREPCVMARRGFSEAVQALPEAGADRWRQTARRGNPAAVQTSVRAGCPLPCRRRRTDGPIVARRTAPTAPGPGIDIQHEPRAARSRRTRTDAHGCADPHPGPNDRLRTFNPDFGSCIHRNDRFETAVAVGIYGPGSPVVRWDAYIDPSRRARRREGRRDDRRQPTGS